MTNQKQRDKLKKLKEKKDRLLREMNNRYRDGEVDVAKGMCRSWIHAHIEFVDLCEELVPGLILHIEELESVKSAV